VIPENKPFIFVRGNGKGRTSISHESSSSDNAESAAFTVNADNIVVFGVSFRVRARPLALSRFRLYVRTSSS